jgi:hypothetical protein
MMAEACIKVMFDKMTCPSEAESAGKISFREMPSYAAAAALGPPAPGQYLLDK